MEELREENQRVVMQLVTKQMELAEMSEAEVRHDCMAALDHLGRSASEVVRRLGEDPHLGKCGVI